ncbi:hypothetical protein SOVF_196090 [Spinacia oleracea]|uniref:NHL repeat-containing protein n=1 Tax=Spinacia oleracea TaxID=3562 RepID=A0A9R0IBY3_SPIOL|nr:uncharacterized protein LOC110786242 [Spinacia oleracea]KNA04827.1 hypothetical protein SOVF_196090 [Spinacia oleracea]
MRTFLIYLTIITIFLPHFPPATAAVSTPAGPLIKHLSSLFKWSKNSPKSSQSDGPVVQFEKGYLVETVVEGNALGVLPYSIRVSEDGELFAVDSEASNIVRITPPLSQYSRARLVAGSFQGKAGHVDGKPNDARFNHPKGVAMDDKGNVYIADTENLAIRKVGEGGVTTIAGGKSNVAGYTDGPSEDAKFSTDFDVLYVPSTCSLLVVDRGNAALRQISLNQEDCDTYYSSISVSDIVMVIGAVFVGYASCLLHQGFGPAFFLKFLQPSASDVPEKTFTEKQSSIQENVKEEQVAGCGWPPFGQMIGDIRKLAVESLSNVVLPLIPPRFSPRKGLTPLKDALKMPEDEVKPPLLAQKQRTPAPVSESWEADTSETRTLKMRSATSMKDTSKHRSSKRHEYSEFYGSSEVPHKSGQTRSKPHKERSKHRHRDKSGEISSGSGAHAPEPKQPTEFKGVNYTDPRFNPYNVGNRYMPDGSYRY